MSGDDTAEAEGGVFTRFFREHYDDVRRYALRRLGPDQADDVAAETFSVAWRRFDRVPRKEPLPWLYGVARNITRARSREMRRRGGLSLPHPDGGLHDPGAPDPTGAVADRESALQVLERLSDTDRELIMLLAWEGLEIQEAARVLGCSTPTARVRLYRARRRIERLMDHPPPKRAPEPVTVPRLAARPVLKEKS
ncbi:RNA polymerase sigma factor [Nocardiopsis alba]|jgi:RNA polymerase sigma-70 factor (ECF subfamily)|uniref:RNA polymerase sigma factor n=1 Tax=Nocardiopsis alba TaxID=53437 RepID=UPI0033AEADA1